MQAECGPASGRRWGRAPRVAPCSDGAAVHTGNLAARRAGWACPPAGDTLRVARRSTMPTCRRAQLVALGLLLAAAPTVRSACPTPNPPTVSTTNAKLSATFGFTLSGCTSYNLVIYDYGTCPGTANNNPCGMLNKLQTLKKNLAAGSTSLTVDSSNLGAFTAQYITVNDFVADQFYDAKIEGCDASNACTLSSPTVRFTPVADPPVVSGVSICGISDTTENTCDRACPDGEDQAYATSVCTRTQEANSLRVSFPTVPKTSTTEASWKYAADTTPALNATADAYYLVEMSPENDNFATASSIKAAKVYLNVQTAPFNPTDGSTARKMQVIVTGLTAGTKYIARVALHRWFRASDNSNPSAAVTAVGLPSAPVLSNVQGPIVGGSSTITATIARPADTGQADQTKQALTKYTVQVGTTADFTTAATYEITDTRTDQSTFDLTLGDADLTGVTLPTTAATWHMRVKATNALGDGAYSAASSIVFAVQATCATDQYNDAGTCKACPVNSKSDAGSTAVTACQCKAGYTGTIAAADDTCTICGAGKFKAGLGGASCTSCSCTGCTSAQGSTSASSCECPAGTAGTLDTNGAGTCTSCGPGKFANAAGLTTCADCDKGKYGSGNGLTGCQDCPTHADTVAKASQSSSDCKCVAGRYRDGEICKKCAQGHYKAGVGDGACTPCAVGTYMPCEGATQCESCPTGSSTTATGRPTCLCSAGTVGDLTNVAGCKSTGTCTECEAGKYAGAGDASCAGCVNGKFSEGTGNSECQDCGSLAGSAVTDITKADTLVVSATSSSACVCKRGYTGPGTSCAACAQGKYKGDFGAAACSDCEVGKWASSAAVACTACLDSNHETTVGGDGSGADSNSDCKCKRGYTGPDGGASGTCAQCQAGKFKASAGAATCSDCPANTNSAQASAARTDCHCNAGYEGTIATAEADDTACSQCGAGKYKAAAGLGACDACPLGKFSGAIGAGGKFSSSGAADCLTVAEAVNLTRSTFAQCIQPLSWVQINRSNKTVVRTGGLGTLLEEGGYEVWVCVRDGDGGCGDPWFCWVWHETDTEFRAWGPNSELGLIRHTE